MLPGGFLSIVTYFDRIGVPAQFFMIPPDGAAIKTRGEWFTITTLVKTDVDDEVLVEVHPRWMEYPGPPYPPPGAYNPWPRMYAVRGPGYLQGFSRLTKDEPARITTEWRVVRWEEWGEICGEGESLVPDLTPVTGVIDLTWTTKEYIGAPGFATSLEAGRIVGPRFYRTGTAVYWLFWSLVITTDIEAGIRKIREYIEKYGQGGPDKQLELLKSMKARRLTPPMPDVKYSRSEFPSIWAAGEPLSISHGLRNDGAAGRISLDMTADGRAISEVFDVEPGSFSLPERLMMPYIDITRNYSLNIFSHFPLKIWIEEIEFEGRTYKPIPLLLPTDSQFFSIPIKAGFPEPEIFPFAPPSRLRPGDEFTVDFAIINRGFRGDVGIRLDVNGTVLEKVERIDRNAITYAKYSGEMPVIDILQFIASPIYRGENENIFARTPVTAVIRAMNALFHRDNEIRIVGGHEPFNKVIGFVAGKNVTVTGLDTAPGTGGPLGQILPYSGIIFMGELGPDDTAVIKFDELYFIRVETDRGIATARLKALVERDTKLYEYSTIPTPAMIGNSLKSVVSLLTRVSPRLEVGQ